MIKFNNHKSIPLSESKTLLELAIDHKIELNHSCGGHGTCGTCRVIIDNYEDLPARNAIELEMANDRKFNPNERLACQTITNIQLKVKIP